VFPPLTANPMWHTLEPVSPNMPVVKITSTLPEAGTVRVTAGPGLAGLNTVL